MKHYIIYSHDGSENHGCEALVRSSIKLLNDNNDFILISSDASQDEKYNLNLLCRIFQRDSKLKKSKYSLKFINYYIKQKISKDYRLMDSLYEINYIENKLNRRITKKYIALSIGGDTYCYGFTDDVIHGHNTWKSKGLKNVLWCCSVEEEALKDKKVLKDIKSFDLIIARESITFDTLKKVGCNVELGADPAFLLEKTKPDKLLVDTSKKYVGINLSPMVIAKEKENGIALENYLKCIDYILTNTDNNILLIPHVVWKRNDDRVVLKTIKSYFENNTRVVLINDENCSILKYYISLCSFFIGARTHATIAAYSQYIPTLTIGYSVKSRGIAKDLFGAWENYVLPIQNIKTKEELTKAFIWLLENEESIRGLLKKQIPLFEKLAKNNLKLIESLK